MRDLPVVRDEAGERLLRVGHVEARRLDAAHLDDARVAGLPARFAVERRHVGDDDRVLALDRAIDEPLPSVDDRERRAPSPSSRS